MQFLNLSLKQVGCHRTFLFSICNHTYHEIFFEGTCPPIAAQLIRKYKSSHDVELQQRCVEFEMLLQVGSNVMGNILPIDASCEDLGDDVELSFLDSYVNDKLNAGASSYSPPENIDDDEYLPTTTNKREFNMTPYAKPSQGNTSSAAVSRVYNPESGSVSSSTAPSQSREYHSNDASQQHNLNNGQPTLNLRNAANVWGKQPTSSSFSTNVPIGNANSFGVGPSSHPMAQNTHASVGVPYEPEKPKELTEREKMASALFGGVGGAPSTSGRLSRPTKGSATKVMNTVPTLPTTPSSPNPGPEPVIDLLDMTSFVDELPSTAAISVPSGIETLSSTADFTLEVPSQTISEQQDDKPVASSPIIAPAPAVDPFAAQGLLSDIEDKPLAGFGTLDKVQSPTQFSYNGKCISPLTWSTPEFGQKWGSIPFTNTSSISNANVSNLNQFMNAMEKARFFPIEAIAATDEGICAASVGGSTILLHGKLTKVSLGAMARTLVDITIKSTDINLGDPLVTYLSEVIR